MHLFSIYTERSHTHKIKKGTQPQQIITVVKKLDNIVPEIELIACTAQENRSEKFLRLAE